MKKIIVSSLVLGTVLACSTLWAVGGSLESFYSDSIERKIEKCERKARHIDSRGENLRKTGEQALDQANFYRTNKDGLVRSMEERDVGENPAKVDHFLIKAYVDGEQPRKVVTSE
jgi:septation ring formation regulator EzrA